MPFYPDWIIALDDVAKSKAGAVVTPRDAQNIIAELTRLKGQVKALSTPAAERTPADNAAVFAVSVDRQMITR